MSKALVKDIFRSIKRTMARFISIVAIVALGISVFAGIKATAPDLKDTAEKYFSDNNLMDINVISTIGLTDTDVYNISKISGVEAVMPSKFADALLEVNGKALVDVSGSPFCCRAMSLDLNFPKAQKKGIDDAAYMNRVNLLAGVLPAKPNECLVDSCALTSTHKFKIGDMITLKGDNENLSSKLNVTEFKIVGIVETPLYISVERGNTLIGSGKLGNYIYIPQEDFSTDYYTNVYVTVAGANAYKDFTAGYNNFISPVSKAIEGISKDRLFERGISLSLEYTPKVKTGKIELAKKEAEVKAALAAGRAQVEQIKYTALHGDAEIAAKKAKYENSLSAAQKELYLGKDQYNKSFVEYNQKLEEYNAAKAIADQNPNARADYAAAVQKLADADKQIKAGETSIALFNNIINVSENALNSTDGNAFNELVAGLKAAGVDTTVIEILGAGATGNVPDAVKTYLLPILEGYKTRLAQAQTDLDAAKAQYAANKLLVDAAAKNIAKLDQLDAAYAQLKDAESKLQTGSTDISVGELTLNMKQMELKDELAQAEANLALAKAKAGTIDADFAKQEADANLQLQNARYDLNSAENMLASLDTAKWYAETRDDLPGHVEYGQSADNMKAFSAVFPVFFFFIAAVVSLTTMARMVEEERVQLGTLKALGYGPASIAAKYLIYAVLASLIGSIIGLSFGFFLYPKAIYNAYAIMFTTPPIILTFRMGYAILGTVIVVLAVAAATLFACRSELTTCPAQLMRPKAPKAGKRVFLERVGFIWGRLSFSSKVTVRNLFRNKKRFIMTIIGISGCTALLLTGLGINDSIGAISKKQFGANGIEMYDAQIVLNEVQDSTGSTNAASAATLKDIKSDSRIKDAMLSFSKTLNSSSVRAKGVILPTCIFVPQDSQQLSSFVKLQNRKTGEKYELGDQGVLITEKFANKTKTKVGDEIFVKLNDSSSVNLKVAGIVENYAFHYIYMSETLYKNTFGETPQYNFVTAQLADNIKAMNETNQNAEKSKLASDLMKRSDVSVVVYTDQTIGTFNNIIKGLNSLVMIFIISAGALAFVVLYNLSNININERLRELATIKVLGFYDREVSSYIYRENMVLTILGTGLGILLGIPLHLFVINVAEVNIVMFGRSINWSSMLIAAGVTIAFSVIVNLIMHKKLKKISMVESLKSVE